ncbi:MAG: hypothetical protein ATN35_07050 [Epulopiscium sp. Nele67-Bin004]|nr:MAG: hypothetical protein ATN35_07050 [Epulopiscium sp. Nele67-Bin004]
MQTGGPQGISQQNGGPQGTTSQEFSPENMPPESMMQAQTPPNIQDMAQNQQLPPNTQEGMTPPPTSSEGGVSKDEGQFWSNNYYLVEAEGSRDGEIAFGVNHATGHIKAYLAEANSSAGMKYVRAVRGEEYGVNQYVDNGNGTITDNETGLMWMSVDTGEAVNWEEALIQAENSEFAGYSDWRLPDVKELQSIIDYSGSYPAIDQDFFTCTELAENEFYYYWTSTSAYFNEGDVLNPFAWYVAFGFAVDDTGSDYHGAGGVRFSPKYPESEALGEGGDNSLNSVRLVRTISE